MINVSSASTFGTLILHVNLILLFMCQKSKYHLISPVSHSTVIVSLDSSASPYWLFIVLDLCREHRVMPILKTVKTVSVLYVFLHVYLSKVVQNVKNCLVKTESKLILNIFWGSPQERRPTVIWTSSSVVSLKTQTSKPKVRPDESYRKERKICVWVCVTVCVLVKGLKKKEEVKHSEYIPTGMRLTDNPIWLLALQQSQGVVVVF